MPQTRKKRATEPGVGYAEPFHPGMVIRRRLFEPLNISQKKFCEIHGISETKFSRVLNGIQPITADTAIELAKAFGLSEMFFMNLRNRHELEMAKRKRGAGPYSGQGHGA